MATRIHEGRVLLDVLALSERDLAELPDLVRGAIPDPARTVG